MIVCQKITPLKPVIIVPEQGTKKPDNVLYQRTVEPITKHIVIHYLQNSKDDGRRIYDVFISGTDYIGKIQAKFLNKHPEMLVKFLSKQGVSVTQKELR